MMNWREIIHPETANVILGARGKGKTGLAFYLMEKACKEYNMTPCLVNFPEDKKHLVPSNYKILELDDMGDNPDSVILIDEGTTLIPAGKAKLEEIIKGCQALCRQRNQIILIIFHASSDVGSRILRGMDVLMIKRPSRRQIQWGSKDSYSKTLLERAHSVIPPSRKDLVLVDSEEPDFNGILVNPLCSFWSEELSKAWATGKLAEGAEKLKKITRRMILNKKRTEILDWAIKNGWVINPSKGMEDYVQHQVCPMDAKLACPCKESVRHVEVTGKCAGNLYWKNYKVYEEVILK